MQNTPSLLYSQSEENQHKVGQHLRIEFSNIFTLFFLVQMESPPQQKTTFSMKDIFVKVG